MSRALRGSSTVSEPTRKRIEAIAQQLNYKVDKNASSLRRQRSNTLALLFFEDPTPDDSQINPFFLSMLGAITRACAARGYDLLISFQQLSANWHVDYEDSRKADGIILLGYGDYELYRARLDQLVGQGTHFVRWGHVQPGQPGTTIGCDNFQGGYAAACHLIQNGRRRIAFLGEANDHYPEFLDRYRGACEAQRSNGIAVDRRRQVDALNTEQSGYDAARTLLSRGVTIDALFAASDLIALGALRALREAGTAVPDEVAIIGFDDLPAAAMARPPLTTVHQDARGAGEALVDALIRLVNNEPVASVVLPAKLVVRQSA